MEYMDKGSFDGVYKSIGAIDIRVVGKVALCVLEGLGYLYDVHRIIHRGTVLSPSSHPLSSRTRHKTVQYPSQLVWRNQAMRLWRVWRTHKFYREFLCRDLHIHERTSHILSLPLTLTSFQPERIQGGDYTIKSDVWSLGITLIELAHGRFPFNDSYSDDEGDDDDYLRPAAPSSPVSRRKSRGVSLHGSKLTMSIIELMHQIVKEPAPRLMDVTPDGTRRFPAEAAEFVDSCLDKNAELRGMPRTLSVSAIIYQVVSDAHLVLAIHMDRNGTE